MLYLKYAISDFVCAASPRTPAQSVGSCQQVVLDEIERQLSYEPTVETRHRKRLRPNPVAPWQLSVSDFRILYDVDDARQMVEILVVGRKVHEKLFVAGKEVKL